jgi:hypothetical protein
MDEFIVVEIGSGLDAEVASKLLAYLASTIGAEGTHAGVYLLGNGNIYVLHGRD